MPANKSDAELAKSAAELTKAVRNNDASTQRLAKRLRWTIIGAGITAVLVAVSIVLVFQVRGVQEDRDRTRKLVLCPLYDLFLGSYNPDSPTAKADPAKYEAQFDVIRSGYVVLACPPKQ